MMDYLIGLVFLGCLATIAEMAIPEGFVLEVEHECGSDISLPATVKVKSDLSFKVIATCAGKVKKEINAADDVTMVSFNVEYSAYTKGSNCHFISAPNTNMYKVFVDVYWSAQGPKSVISHDEKYVVTCTTGPKAVDQETVQHPVEEPAFPPKVLHEHHETVSNEDKVEMILLDAAGRRILGKEVMTPGKKLYLLGMRDPPGALGSSVKPQNYDFNAFFQSYNRKSRPKINFPPGLLPVDCVVTDSEGKRKYQMIRGGCGDGIVFPHNVGFDTFWGRTRSPLFRFFFLQGKKDLQFTCSFILCDFRCDGNSCDLSNSRKRRESGGIHKGRTGRIVKASLTIRTGNAARQDDQRMKLLLAHGKVRNVTSPIFHLLSDILKPQQSGITNSDGDLVDGRHEISGFIVPVSENKKDTNVLENSKENCNTKEVEDDSNYKVFVSQPGYTSINGDVSDEKEDILLPWVLAYVAILLTIIVIALLKHLKYDQWWNSRRPVSF